VKSVEREREIVEKHERENTRRETDREGDIDRAGGEPRMGVCMCVPAATYTP